MYFPIISEISRKRKKAKMLEIKKNEIIKKEYLALKDKIEKSCKEHNSGEYGRVEKRNKICPKCGSNLVNDRIRRVEGEIKGSVSGSFIFGTGGLYGSTSGTIDTNEVNKCNSCGNAWNKSQKCAYGSGEGEEDEEKAENAESEIDENLMIKEILNHITKKDE